MSQARPKLRPTRMVRDSRRTSPAITSWYFVSKPRIEAAGKKLLIEGVFPRLFSFSRTASLAAMNCSPLGKSGSAGYVRGTPLNLSAPDMPTIVRTCVGSRVA